jgi:hypothetical protein
MSEIENAVQEITLLCKPKDPKFQPGQRVLYSYLILNGINSINLNQTELLQLEEAVQLYHGHSLLLHLASAESIYEIKKASRREEAKVTIINLLTRREIRSLETEVSHVALTESSVWEYFIANRSFSVMEECLMELSPGYRVSLKTGTECMVSLPGSFGTQNQVKVRVLTQQNLQSNPWVYVINPKSTKVYQTRLSELSPLS